MEKALKEVERGEQLNEQYRDGECDMLEFYGDLRSQLQGKVYTNTLSFGSLPLQLPFFDALVIPIDPIRTAESFTMAYQASVPQLLDLYRKGRVVFTLSGQYVDFAGLDYLDDLLELGPPSPVTDGAWKIHLGTRYGLDIEGVRGNELHGEFFKRLIALDTRSLIRMEEMTSNLGSRIVTGGMTERLTKDCVDLAHFGYEDFAFELLDSPDPILSVMTYSRLLAGVPITALDGIQSISPGSFESRLNSVAFSEAKRIFPADIGKLLITKHQLLRYQKIGLEESIQLSEHTKEARMALYQLDQAVRSQKDVADRTEALQPVWNKTIREVARMKEADKWVGRLAPFVLGGVGQIADMISGTRYVLTTLLGGLGLVSGEEISNRVVTLGKPNHVVALFDLEKATSQDKS